jgi:hypothetical protein
MAVFPAMVNAAALRQQVQYALFRARNIHVFWLFCKRCRMRRPDLSGAQRTNNRRAAIGQQPETISRMSTPKQARPLPWPPAKSNPRHAPSSRAAKGA